MKIPAELRWQHAGLWLGCFNAALGGLAANPTDLSTAAIAANAQLVADDALAEILFHIPQLIPPPNTTPQNAR